MDLGAYGLMLDNDTVIEKALSKYHIEIPRVRGYRYMKYESLVTEEDIKDIIENAKLHVLEDLISICPRWSPLDSGCFYRFGPDTDRLVPKYFTIDKNTGEVSGIKWNAIHGKKRKRLKLEIRKTRKRIIDNLSTFNKYVGRDDIIYIHARLNSFTWSEYAEKNNIYAKSWYVDSEQDWFDSSYSDIYVKVDPEDLIEFKYSNN